METLGGGITCNATSLLR